MKYSLLFIVLALLSSCVKRELILEPGEQVRIIFDWSKIADTTAVPSAMQLWFYGADNVPLSRQASSTGYEGVLPAGNYRVIIYNPDASGVGFRNLDRFETGEVYALPQTGGMLAPSQQVYGVSIAEFKVSPGKTVDTTVSPLNYERTLVVRVKVEGDDGVISGMKATIEGVAKGANLATAARKPGGNAGMEQTLETGDPYYEGTFYLFGLDEQNPANLMLEMDLSDGTERTIRENITEALRHLNQQTVAVPLLVELTIGVTEVDGVFVATLNNWIYRENEVVIH